MRKGTTLGLAPGLVSRIGHPVNEPNITCWRKVSENPKYNLGEEKLYM